MPTMTVQSAAMRRLRRELETSRMRAALAPARGITKKLSPTRLFPAPTASSAPRPARCADGLDHAPPSPFVVSHPCHAAAHAGGFSKGEQVRVRTPVGTLSTGQRLVLWLGAVVVSAAEEEDGYLGVSYTHYKHPCSDLSGAVRVPKKDVKDMLPPPAAAIATTAAASAASWTIAIVSHSARPSQGKATPRPTVAGKKPSLLKKMEKEMRSRSDAILASW